MARLPSDLIDKIAQAVALPEVAVKVVEDLFRGLDGRDKRYGWTVVITVVFGSWAKFTYQKDEPYLYTKAQWQAVVVGDRTCQCAPIALGAEGTVILGAASDEEAGDGGLANLELPHEAIAGPLRDALATVEARGLAFADTAPCGVGDEPNEDESYGQ